MKPTGQQIVDKALEHIGEQYVLGTVVPKNDPAWDGPWDCAEFVSWCVYQVAEILYGCQDDTDPPAIADAYTGYWGRDARSKGNIIPLSEAARTPGAAVLRLGSPMGHIVISDGSGGTVEAHSTNAGVIQASLGYRRWDMGILVPGIEYQLGEPGPIIMQPAEIYRLDSPYMRGGKIFNIQGALQSRGYYLSKIDGVFGPLTLTAVRRFQQERGLVPDGEVGPITLSALGVK